MTIDRGFQDHVQRLMASGLLFGEAVRQARADYGITQAEPAVATTTPMPSGSYTELEQRRRNRIAQGAASRDARGERLRAHWAGRHT